MTPLRTSWPPSPNLLSLWVNLRLQLSKQISLTKFQARSRPRTKMKTFQSQSGQSTPTQLLKKTRFRPSWKKWRNSTSIGKSFMMLQLKHHLTNKNSKTLASSRRSKVKLISSTILQFKRSSRRFTLTERNFWPSLLSCRMRAKNLLLLNRLKMRRRMKRNEKRMGS